jgi:NTE family protein
MFTRLIAAALISLLITPGQAFCREKPVHFTLTYTTTHGGLKEAVPPGKEGLPKLGLALAGGGAKAAASIGILKVLAKEGIPVSAVSGTSMGALVGGLLAAGYGPEEIERIFLANDWNDIFKDTPSRAFLTQEQKEAGSRHLLEFSFKDGRFMPPTGLSAGQKLANLLAAKTLAASFQAGLDFDKLAIPFRAVAADIETGETVVLKRGLLHDAMRASAAIPLAFQPVEVGGRLLVDGGLVNNLPVDIARSMGAEVVIAVDSSSKLETREKLTSLVEIMSQSISIEVHKESRRQAALADLVITPDTSAYSFTDFPKMTEIVRIGEEAAREALPHIRELMKQKAGPRPKGERFSITSLAVRGNRSVPEATIRFAMSAALAPRTAGREDVLSAMAEVYKLGYFADVVLDLEKQGESYGALLTVAENPVVAAVDITGNRMVPSREIMAEVEGQVGKPLNVARLSSALDRIVERYRNKGYLLVRVDRAGMKADGSTLEIALYEGRVDSIQVEGRKKTKPSLIRREVRTRTGGPLNFDILAQDIQHLYGLGYFESLSVDMAKGPQGGVDLTLKIREKPTAKVRLGLRYDLEDSFTGLTDVVVDNITGRGIKVYLNMRYGNYSDVTLGYYSPVFLRSYFVHTLEAFYRQRDYFTYLDKKKTGELEVIRTGLDVAFGYQWFKFGDTYIRYRYSNDSSEDPLGLSLPQESIHIGSWAFLTTIDTRDSNTFAHRGFLFKGSYETAAPAYGSSIEFTKTSAHAQGVIPLGERHSLIFEGSFGIGSGEIPYHEKFGIGGADYLISTPLPGYQRREFVGSNLVNYSLSYRWKIKEYQLNVVKAIYLGLGGHAANVWDSRDQMSFSASDLKKGAGIGLYADTIIGPVRLDFGAGEDHRYTVYFSAGFDF